MISALLRTEGRSSMSWVCTVPQNTACPLETKYNDYANPLVCAVFVAMCPVWVLIARKIPATREVLYSGWEPVIIAMAISRRQPGGSSGQSNLHLSPHEWAANGGSQPHPQEVSHTVHFIFRLQ
ncbi:hypothetical protein GOODEAATRI_031010 [Goodea atripinnis]|uniref:Solute carrier family 41 member n=1 Tax=Goodea atripinnis TaxID=208336 RepID=A0ABV0NPV6_9TELE